MQAVWSFWSRPYRVHRRSTWASEKHHLLAWVLSFEAARVHYPRTALYTDDAGARLLVDGLGLAFDTVSTALNECAGYDPGWWAVGKLYTYRLQCEPFVHVDSDVFLWKRLPAALEGAAVLAQSPEPFMPGASFYKPEQVEHNFRSAGQGWLPAEWKWYRRSRLPQRAECCGIFGGTHLPFIRRYAEAALEILDHPLNRRGWSRFADKIGQMVLVEQYVLSACLEYHRAHVDSPLHPVEIQYLFHSSGEASDRERVSEAGYTHLIAGAKRDRRVADKLESRVRSDYPEQYQRCLKLLGQRDQDPLQQTLSAA